MDRLISLQAAIDAADSIIDRDTSGNNDVVKAMTAWKEYIKGLPSAQTKPQWIPCNMCKHYEGVHEVPGHAPCAFWGVGAVMWHDACKRAEPWRGEEDGQTD